MNTRTLIATGMVCATVAAVAAFLSNAGPLSPPAGPIAPTHKTLTEVEPRIAVNAANTPGDNDASPSLFKITQPGSYYLTGNIVGVSGKHGIEIGADDVTLDLMGYALLGVPGSLNGINMPATQEGVVIRNGAVSNWGGDGVKARLNNGAIERVHARQNGGWGVDNFVNTFSSRITRCSALLNGAGVASTGGIRAGGAAVVESCLARRNTGDGIFAGAGSTVSGNTAQSNGGDGIFASSGSTVRGNTARVNADDGIVVGAGSTISGNTAQFNTGDGIQVSADSLVLNNACDSNGNGGDGAGIHAISSGTRIESNIVTDNDRGIDVDFAGNIIIKNTASGNADNYDIATGNSVGQGMFVVGSTITTGNPWVNFSF